MKTETTKLAIYPNEDVILIAPTEIMKNFLINLCIMADEAARNARRDNRNATAQTYDNFWLQVDNVIEEIK